MKYQVRIAAGAAREIAKLPQHVVARILDVIDELADDPRPPGVKTIKGIADCHRVRSGAYRIVYTIQDNVLKVGVVTVGHRSEVYKGLRGKVRRGVQ